MTQYKMVIDGEAVATDKTFTVLNPATGEALAQCPDCDAEHVDAAVAAAKRAFPAWAATPQAERKACVLKAQEVFSQHFDEIVETICKEQGKPRGGETKERLTTGASLEFAMTTGLFGSAAEFSAADKVWKEDDTHEVVIIRKPLGVVAGIAPWNFPVYCYLAKLLPSVMYGNTFVGKPSPFTPLAVLRVMELIKDCFPKGVINVVVSDDARWKSGAHLTSHPDIAKVSFTGSVPTGKAIMK
eukprot:Rhum_TRINITY_DN14914_c0_g1::Rhum_TRINITY_DN14914_c0_g1_i5::g.127211::m.127211